MTVRQETSVGTGTESAPAFEVRLDNFEGPFDLLLNLISKHRLDITEVALSQVTDEFIAFVKAGGPVWDLEQTTSFLLVASTCWTSRRPGCCRRATWRTRRTSRCWRRATCCSRG